MKNNLLVIGDTHFPAVHPGYFAFCKMLAEKYDCNKFMHIGDVCDWHSVSHWNKHPEADGPLYEYEEALKHTQKWHAAFPKMMVCEGNHDLRVARQAATVNIPTRLLKGYNELWETPGWVWRPSFVIDDVYYFHGTGAGGIHPAYNTMQKMLMSTVMGHVHTAGGIKWRANPDRRTFGMDTGCGVNDKHVAFVYGENLKVRSILSAAVVLDGMPMHVIMPASRGEPFHKSRF